MGIAICAVAFHTRHTLSGVPKYHLLFPRSLEGEPAQYFTTFHMSVQKCANTFTHSPGNDDSFVFGGYASDPWVEGEGGEAWGNAKSFLFSLTNNMKVPYSGRIPLKQV
jgi:hypothetical protein